MEDIVLGSAVRTAVSEYAASNSVLPPDTWTGFEAQTSKYVKDVTYAGGTRIRVQRLRAMTDRRGEVQEAAPSGSQP